MAFIGSFFSCLLPESVTNNAPVDNQESNSSSQNNYGQQKQSLISNNNSVTKRTNSTGASTTHAFAGPGMKLGRA
eukprot:gene6353-8751_t